MILQTQPTNGVMPLRVRFLTKEIQWGKTCTCIASHRKVKTFDNKKELNNLRVSAGIETYSFIGYTDALYQYIQ